MPTARITCASAPSRIDFAGGWTDVPPYTIECGGHVCNLAIARRATVRVSDTPDVVVPAEPIVRAAWQAAGEPTVSIDLRTDFPAGSGLGGSSAIGVALAAALQAHVAGAAFEAHALAERSRHTEVAMLGVPGGCQDHFAAAYGGALLLHCGAETDVIPLALSDHTIDELEARARIVYTGVSRMSGTMIDAVLGAWRDGDPTVRGAMDAMATLAPQVAAALEAGDLSTLGTLLRAQWQAQRTLHPGITTPTIDAIERDALAAGAQAIKALGASGGGCVVVLAPRERMAAVETTLAIHGEVLPWRVARRGVLTWTEPT